MIRSRSRSRGGVVSAAFTPASLSGLELWLDASDVDTLWADTGATTPATSSVARWDDKSGNSYNATQATSAQQPTTGIEARNSSNVLTFTTSPVTMLSLPSTLHGIVKNQEVTIFCAGGLNGLSGIEGRFISGRNASGNTRLNLTSNNTGSVLRGTIHNSGTSADQSVTWGAGNIHAFGMVRNGQGQATFFDGLCQTTQANASDPTLSDLTIGARGDLSASFSLNGVIGEIIMYSRRLTQAEIRSVNSYLSGKWGVVVSNFVDPVKTITAFGDSITQGSLASDPSHYWHAVYAATLGATKVLNKGISGTPMQNSIHTSAPVNNNAYDTYVSRCLGNSKSDLLLILYGLNDVGYNVSGVDFSLANFISDYQGVIDGLIAGGYTSDQIVLGSPPWIPTGNYNYSGTFTGSNATIHQQHVDAVYDLAVANGLKYADVYSYMRDNGGVDLIYSPGEIHPNDDGHAAIATAMTAADYV